MSTLTIRNLTSTPLKITHTSRFPPPQPALSQHHPIATKNTTNVSNIAYTFISLLRRPSPGPPTSAQLAENAKAFEERRDVDITIGAYSRRDTGLEVLVGDATVRLEFESGRGKFRMDIERVSGVEVAVVPRGEVHGMGLVGVFHSARFHLAIVSSADLAGWMAHLADATSLAKLSIPGTHNSPTCHFALPSVRCQAVSITSQLENGVRFLDIRAQPDGRDMVLVHGAFPIAVSGTKRLAAVMDECYAFLDRNRSETVIISLKREGRGNTNDEDFAMLLKEVVVDAAPQRWYTSSHVPTLGSARGKCILFRRFKVPAALVDFGINAEWWAYNTPNHTTEDGRICVQDFCEVLETENIAKKVDYIKQHLVRSAVPPPEDKLFLNFLSATNFWRVGCWPDRIAAKINPVVCEHLAVDHEVDDGRAGTGVVVTDFVGADKNWAVCKLVVGMNAALLVGK